MTIHSIVRLCLLSLALTFPAHGEISHFEAKVLPILASKCFGCHSSVKERPKAGLRLDTREGITVGSKDGKILVPGKPEESSLWTLCVLPLTDEDAMPPPEKDNPLSKAEQQSLKTWIVTGADFGGWVAYQHLDPAEDSRDGATSLPFSIRDTQAAAKHIEALVNKELKAKGVAPNPPVTDEIFLRRLSLDVIGMIPSYEQAAAFYASADPHKRQQLIDTLLGSEGYAHHGLNYWADILRLRTKKDFLQYLNWVQDSLRENKPYDKFVYELLSGTGITAENGAAGYMHRDRDMPLDHTANTMRVFLGTQIGCAQCHDHPFDKWSQKDFYGMSAFLYGTKTTHPDGSVVVKEIEERFGLDRKNEADAAVLESVSSLVNYSGRRAVHDYGIDAELKLPHDYQYDDGRPGDVVPPRVPFGDSPKLQSGEAPRTAFARWVTSPANPLFARVIANRLWSRTMGRGIVEPIDDFRSDNAPSNPELLDFLARAMTELDFDVKAFQRMIYFTGTYQRMVTRTDLPAGVPYAFPGPVMRRMSAEQIWDSSLVLLMPDPLQRSNPKLEKFKATCPDYVNRPLEEIYAIAKETPGLQMGRRFRKYLKEEQPLAHLDRPIEENDAYKKVPAQFYASSRLEMPASLGHFLRQFGQSDRVSIDAANRDPTVPQVLTMLNGPLLDELFGTPGESRKKANKFTSVLQTTLAAAESPEQQLEHLFLSVLSRHPTPSERRIWSAEIARGNLRELAWVLLNSNEFLFVQ